MMPKAMRLALGSAWAADRRDVVLLGLFRALAGVVPAVTTYLLSILFSQASQHRLSAATIISFLVALLVSVIVPPVSQYLVLRISHACAVTSRASLYKLLAKFPTLELVEGPQRQDEVRRAIDAASQSPILTVDGAMAFVQGTVSILCIFGLIFAVSPSVALGATLLAIPIAVVRLRAAALRADAQTEATPLERRSLFYEQLLTNLDYAKELRTLELFDLFRNRMVHQLKEAQKPLRLADRREVWVQVTLGALGVCVVGASVIALRSASVQVITIIVVGVPQLVSQLGATLNSVGSMRTSLRLFNSYIQLSERARCEEQPGGRSLSPLRDGITFVDVWFRYPGSEEWALRGINLHITAGCSTGIVGRNGAGKSTIAALMCGLYRPTAGKILWDGVDLAEVDMRELRRRINIAFQRPTQYEMTVSENVWLGDSGKVATTARVTECLERVSLLSRVKAMPRAADTMLSKSFSGETDKDVAGSLLSGGEWQRLVLARLHFRWPRDLTILDEPTANLDPISERSAHEAMRTLLRGRTSVTIAHRLQLVADSDTILVLNDGEVVQTGRHGDLIARRGMYRRMCEAQLAPVADSGRA